MKNNGKMLSLVGVLMAEFIILFLLSILWTGKSDALEGTITLDTTTGPDNPLAEAESFTDAMPHPLKRAGSSSSVPDYNRKKVRRIYQSCKKNLVLVNADHALKADYKASLEPVCRGRLYASRRLHDSLTQMLSDASREGFHFWIASAYRSRKKQQKLVEEDIRKGMRKGMSYEEALLETYKETMPPGHSEHETGLALDILCSGNMRMDISQKSEPGNQWLKKNCFKYGFILRYPENKEEITGVNYEPWHFRYVGEKAAMYMKKERITLEEFWERLE